jgi:putative spermidine/putrescine transport system permease protein
MRLFVNVSAVIVALFILLPTLVVIPLAFNDSTSLQFPPLSYGTRYFEEFFSDPVWMRAIRNSFLIASATAFLTIIIVVPASYGIERYRIRGGSIVLMLVLSPILIPNIVSAVGYFRFFGDLRILGTHMSVIIAHTCLSIPPSLLVMLAVMRGYPQNLDRAAAMCGANPRRAFLLVSLPVLRPGIIVASVFAFLQSFDETVLVLFIGGRNATTLPKRIFESLRTELDPVIPVVSTVLIFFACFMFALIFYLRRKNGQNF